MVLSVALVALTGAALLSLLTSTAESLESVVFELVVPSALSVSLIAVLVCACCAAVALGRMASAMTAMGIGALAMDMRAIAHGGRWGA